MGQSKHFEGAVKDVTHIGAVSDVHIFDINGNLRAVSDHFGDFYLHYEDHEIFKASCIGYKSISFPISTLLTDSVIYLAEDTVKLSEIVITPLSAHEIIQQSIQKFDEYYLSDSIFTTGAFKFVAEREDSVVFLLSNEELQIVMENPDYSPQIINTTNSLINDNSDPVTNAIFNDFENEMKNIFFFDHIIHKRGFFNLHNLEMWHFKIKGYTIFQGSNLIIIDAKFIDHTNKLHHTGEIFINEVDFGVVKIEFNYEWGIRNYAKSRIDSLWIDDLKWNGRANYLKNDGKYTLSNLEYKNIKRVSRKTRMNKFKKNYDYKIHCNFTTDIVKSDLQEY